MHWSDVCREQPRPAALGLQRYDDATGDQFVTRWPAAVEYVRRGDSATSLGQAEAYSDLLLEPEHQG